MSAKSKNIVNDGGPAFPRDSYKDAKTGLIVRQNGMSLRDWFAGQCDIEAYNPIETFKVAYRRTPTAEELAKFVAEIRYLEADAMIAAREAKP